ncbi:MAG TPA: DUF1214 domain-containing protein [Acidimicrobiia bacterium]|nr:DUF1214 domain-containing protein [Acidimicrobiia bacterium]
MAETASRAAFRELLDTLAEIDTRYLSPEWGVSDARDDADGHRLLMHLVESAVVMQFELDPDRPTWRRIVTPTRKALGDNPDAIYFEAAVNPKREYHVTGNLAGAVYTSFTVEAGATEGRYSTRTAGVLNDTQIDVAPDGSYEIFLGGPPRDRNWLALPDDAAAVITRHYFEEPEPVAADPNKVVPLTISTVEPVGPPAPWDDDSIAAGIKRVTTYLRGRTVEQPPRGTVALPSWVGTVPNVFPKPERPGDMAFSAFDAAYSVAPYALGPDEALVITGRWPACVFANVSIWNRFLQTYDYVNRRVSLNRSNTVLEPDGSWRMVLAHHDPGVPNWIDTEGRPSGQVYWRYFLPEGDVPTPEATVVRFADLTA